MTIDACADADAEAHADNGADADAEAHADDVGGVDDGGSDSIGLAWLGSARLGLFWLRFGFV